jgi:PAS domain S-box-containing protein
LEDAPAVEAGAFATALAETTQSLVCVLDRDGRILLFNDACERATGFGRDEVLGRDARESVIPREEAAAFGDFLAQIWVTGHPSPQVGHWMTKDGKRRLIVWSNKPVLGENDEPRYLAQEQRALRRVATLVASEATPERVFEAVSEESARVLEVNAAAVFRFDPDDTITVVGRWAREDVGAFPLGSTFKTDDNSSVGRVRRTGFPARIDNWQEIAGPVADTMNRSGYRCSVGAPIVVGGVTWGAVSVADAEILPPESESRLAAFCELVSLAVASAQARTDLQASRARLVTSADNERRRLERNLHDGAQQRLVSLSLSLRLAQTQLQKNPEMAEQLLESAREELAQALEELRELARGIHPAILTDRGLDAALEALASRAPLPVEIERPATTLPPPVEAAAYYVVSEALANVAKYAEASSVRVSVAQMNGAARVEVSDDGVGGADPTQGSGLRGLADRVAALNGTLEVESVPGQGTTIRAEIPLG